MWHHAKDVARALKDCVRRLYTQAYHSWSEIPNSIRQALFNNFKYWNTDKFKAISEQTKRQEAVLRVARCTPEVQRPLEQLHERWKKNWDSLPLNWRFSRRLMLGRKKMSRIRMCGWRKGPNELLMSFSSTSLRIYIVRFNCHLNFPPRFGKKKW
ncbi:hypothetical protein MTR67_044231 [Solanum verrucosum]|uniref:Uncharacterized protein n=1 Tax=Solanum verrucosum TaxID=315347 RepID=A0AAF0UTJ5_SOLVR|nr:hypothetical protein MTR67_044231 [Solanum verrucosum]